MPPFGGICYSEGKLLALFACLCAFALLVSDTAAGLASGLARGLALAATTVLCACAKVTCLNSLDVFHDGYLHKVFTVYYIIYSHTCQDVSQKISNQQGLLFKKWHKYMKIKLDGRGQLPALRGNDSCTAERTAVNLSIQNTPCAHPLLS